MPTLGGSVGPPLTLKRLQIRDDGCFSYLRRSDGSQVCVTNEHTFGDPGSPSVILQPGHYLCVRGRHTLNGQDWFDTYEIKGVEGHTGVLFHPGNTELDSKACVLPGRHFGVLDGMMAVLESVSAFRYFMQVTAGADEFELDVEAP